MPGRMPNSRARGRAAPVAGACAMADPQRTNAIAGVASRTPRMACSFVRCFGSALYARRPGHWISICSCPLVEPTSCARLFPALHSARLKRQSACPSLIFNAEDSPMAQNRLPILRFLFSIFFFLLAISVAAQTLEQNLTKFAETPAVPGYEQALAAQIRSRLKNFSVQADNLGNLYLTLGSGSPHRLIVAPMDEPGYVVRGIGEDGFLRVQRLPQQAPHPLFDLLHAAQPVVIRRRDGKWVSGVVAGLSTHLQPNRQNAPRGVHPDEIYVDIGASSAAEVSQAGVDLLDPVALDRKLYAMGFGKLTAPAIGDRFGCAALVELLRRIDPTKLRGTLTVAFVAQQWASSRGLDRLTQHVKADELIYVGRLFLRRASPAAESRVLSPPPGGGVLISPADREGELAGLGADFKRLAEENKIPFALGFSAPLPRASYTQGPVLPPQSVHLSVATAWPSTPGEVLDLADLQKLVRLLQAYVQPESLPIDEKGGGGGRGG